MQPSKISVRQEIRGNLEREAQDLTGMWSILPKTLISKNHTLAMKLDQMTTKDPKEYRVSYLNENPEGFF